MKSKRVILIVDDEAPTFESLDVLLGDDYHLLVTKSGEEAIDVVQSHPIDLAFLDITLPGMDGFEVLRMMKLHDESIEVVMLTADEKAKSAMRAIELGAFHYLTKPFDKDDILLLVHRIFEKKKMVEEITSLRDEIEQHAFHNIIGKSKQMKELFNVIKRVSETDSSILITGESGTGKELVARAIHARSPRKDKYFKAINCGAIPDHLLESELFGHEKGAFTGAHERKIGKFEMANQGTIFLDEISAMPQKMQVKLLRVLQEREIERIGSSKTIAVDLRIIAASNAHMRKLVEKGAFREDLYYRLNVIPLHLPPLRERNRDILLLAHYFLKFFSTKFNKPIKGFLQDAKDALQGYAWPGNVRELRNVIERAIVLSESEWISKQDLPIDLAIKQGFSGLVPSSHSTFSLKEALDAYEKRLVLEILERVEWNQTKAAEMLRIHRNTLLAKLDDFGIDTKQLKREQESKQNKAPQPSDQEEVETAVRP